MHKRSATVPFRAHAARHRTDHCVPHPLCAITPTNGASCGCCAFWSGHIKSECTATAESLRAKDRGARAEVQEEFEYACNMPRLAWGWTRGAGTGLPQGSRGHTGGADWARTERRNAGPGPGNYPPPPMSIPPPCPSPPPGGEPSLGP